MRSRPNGHPEYRYSVFPKVPGIKLCDFPVGSVQSRAAARAFVVAHVEQVRNEIGPEFGKDLPQVLLMMEDLKSALARSYVIRLLRVARVRAKVFELHLTFPTIEEIRRNRARLSESTG